MLSNNLHELTDEETPSLQERVKSAFQLIDVNKDGELSAHEIIKAIHKNSDVRSILLLSDHSELTASEYDNLFSRIDVDSSAGVSFSEFEEFVETIFREERDRKFAEAKRKEEEEEVRNWRKKKKGFVRALEYSGEHGYRTSGRNCLRDHPLHRTTQQWRATCQHRRARNPARWEAGVVVSSTLNH